MNHSDPVFTKHVFKNLLVLRIFMCTFHFDLRIRPDTFLHTE